MRTNGLKTILLAAGLAFAGPVLAQEAVPTGAQPAETQAAQPAADAAATAAPAAAERPADPTLTADGQPRLTVAEGIGQPVDRAIGIQPQVTEIGERAAWFHNVILLPIIALVSLFVLGLIVYVVVRFRRAANPTPSKTSHNTMIEIVWTAAPVIILALIAIPSIRLLAAQYEPAPANAVTLKAIGNQWYWTYEFPDHGGFSVTQNMLREQSEVQPGQRFRTDADGPRLLAVDNRIVLPVGTPVRLITTANDVIHSWAMPAFWTKLDAVPGRLNETSFTIREPGLYFGQCSELCGVRHAYMPIAIEAVEPAVFAQWVAAKGGTMPGAEAAATPAIAAPDATQTPAAATDVPVVNATEAAQPTSQPVTDTSGSGN